jgi:hypothetical protein
MKGWVLGLAVAALIGAAGAARAQAGNNVSAQVEIGSLTSTYAWAVDALDIDTLMTIFSEDVEYDLSVYGLPSVKGRDNVREFFLASVFPINRCSFITISNIWSDVNGAEATGGDYYFHTGFEPVWCQNSNNVYAARA